MENVENINEDQPKSSHKKKKALLLILLLLLLVLIGIAIALPLLGYMGAAVINQLAIQYNIQFLKYFVTLNWDFTQYLYGNLPLMEGLTPEFSAVICIIYMLIMLIPTFVIFKKKNIKNI